MERDRVMREDRRRRETGTETGSEEAKTQRGTER